MAMQTVSVPGFEGREVSVEIGSAFGKPKLFVDGLPAPPGDKKGHYALRRADGQIVPASFKGGFPDPIPMLEVGGHKIRLAEPLSTPQWIWAGFPLILILLGGAIGGLLGGLATVLNVQVMRSSWPVAARWAACAGLTFVAFALWLVVGTALQGLRPR